MHISTFQDGTSGQGDVNSDGSVDLTDGILALLVSAGLEPGDINTAGDANGDG